MQNCSSKCRDATCLKIAMLVIPKYVFYDIKTNWTDFANFVGCVIVLGEGCY